MRSRADGARAALEWTLRGVAIASLGALLWLSVRPPIGPTGAVVTGEPAANLRSWTVEPTREVHVVLGSLPDAREREWLRALGAAGTTVRWSAPEPLGAGAVAAEPIPEPGRGTRVRVASRGGAVAVADEAGPIDSLETENGAVVDLGTVVRAVHVSGDRFSARTALRDSLALRPVLVLGRAGWETKFAVAALEERGWSVAARMQVAPGVEVTQGSLGGLDTARYSAVVALDSSVAPLAGAIARFATSGGGVVLAGATAGIGALASIAPGRPGSRLAGVAGAVAGTAPRTGLPLIPVVALRDDAIALERRGGGGGGGGGGAVAAAARRASLGRVVQLGYDETWRWRMAGGDGSVQAHGAWWSAVVSSVAYGAWSAREGTPRDDEAPVASLVSALGAASPVPDDGPSPDPAARRRQLMSILFTLVVMSLLLEWASRRFRGER